MGGLNLLCVCVLNILLFCDQRYMSKHCCSIVGVQRTVDCDEGASNVPNMLVVLLQSFSFRLFKLLIHSCLFVQHLSVESCVVTAENSLFVCLKEMKAFSVSVLIAIFPSEPLLAGIRISLFWILLVLRMMEVVVTTGAIRRAKLQSDLLVVKSHAGKSLAGEAKAEV